MTSSLSTSSSSNAKINVVNPASKGTIWPEAHKWKLAHAAMNALKSAPANAEKSVHANDIHQILSRNPSYTELCETLEIRGFVVERGPFARTLLAAVPDLESSSQKTAIQQPQSIAQTLMSAEPDSPAPQPQPQPHMFGMLVPQSVPHSPAPQTQTQPQPHVFGMLVPQSVPQAPPVQLISPEPLTKEEMARKRSFGDIVDLTALSDDDGVQSSRNDDVATDDLANSTTMSTSLPLGNSRKRNIEDVNRNWDPSVNEISRMDFSRFKNASLSAAQAKREHFRFANVVRPMKRNDALRRSKYNPKTICRDILVSSGKHPTMNSLNHHLQNLQKNFYDVDSNSDLSTFRWDIVDPGGEIVTSQVKLQSSKAVQIDDNHDVVGPINGISPPKKNFETSRKRRKDLVPDTRLTLIELNDSENRDPSSSHQSAPKATLTPSVPQSEKKRPGRPPGSKDSMRRKNAAIRHKGNLSVRTGRSKSITASTTPIIPSGLRQVMTPRSSIAVVIESRSPSVVEQSQPGSVQPRREVLRW